MKSNIKQSKEGKEKDEKKLINQKRKRLKTLKSKKIKKSKCISKEKENLNDTKLNIRNKDNNNEEIINKIIIKLKIEENEINKNIYFLNCPYYEINGENMINFGLKEFNEFNSIVYIDDKKYEYKKCHKFNKEGEYHIIINFKNLLKDCSCMFSGCKNIINLDLSSFNTQNVTNMRGMFNGCNSLKKNNIVTKNNRILEKYDN